MVLVRCYLNPVQSLGHDAIQHRPADGDGERVPLSSLEKYRDEHELRYPCCLCADGGGRKAYVEAAVYPWWNEVDKNTDWIVRCASDGCGYRG
jgi:hypothetical protein